MADQRLRDPALAEKLLRKIRSFQGEEVSLMEVCGTHTMAIGRHGLRGMVPSWLRLLSGPGCPVCVTTQEDIDRAVAIALEYPVTVTTFGDMFRVPGTRMSLERARSEGASVKMVYSPANALELARRDPSREVLFLGVGFETTTPTVAAALLEAARLGVENFSILPLAKTVPPALETILSSGKAKVDGFILPGHVCAITGTAPFLFLAEKYGKPGVVTGFEPVDILQGIAMLLEMIRRGEPSVEIQYKRVVSPEGNPRAREFVERVFRPCDAAWRSIGTIPLSGLAPGEGFEVFDGTGRFPVSLPEPRENPACLCGEVLMGAALPADCPLFGKACLPESPVGPCMVSSEGTCAAHYKYGGA